MARYRRVVDDDGVVGQPADGHDRSQECRLQQSIVKTQNEPRHHALLRIAVSSRRCTLCHMPPTRDDDNGGLSAPPFRLAAFDEVVADSLGVAQSGDRAETRRLGNHVRQAVAAQQHVVVRLHGELAHVDVDGCFAAERTEQHILVRAAPSRTEWSRVRHSRRLRCHR